MAKTLVKKFYSKSMGQYIVADSATRLQIGGTLAVCTAASYDPAVNPVLVTATLKQFKLGRKDDIEGYERGIFEVNSRIESATNPETYDIVIYDASAIEAGEPAPEAASLDPLP